MTGGPLRILLVEDDERDTSLIQLAMKRGGKPTTIERVATTAEVERALDQPWDAVLADYCLPELSPAAVLKMVSRRGLAMPVIVVSGRGTNGGVANILQAGAAAFVPKDWLELLPFVVDREIQRAMEHGQLTKLQQWESKLGTLVAAAESKAVKGQGLWWLIHSKRNEAVLLIVIIALVAVIFALLGRDLPGVPGPSR